MTTKILNLARLNNKLRRLPDAPKKEIRAALARAAERMTAMMRNLVPVDEGKLRDSIGWTFGKVPRGSLTIGKLVSANLGGDLTVTVYAGEDDPNGAYYSRFVEFGTQVSAAQPFFFVSYRAQRRSARRAVTTAVRKAARKVASGQSTL